MKAFVWKAQMALEKRPAPMRSRKLVMTIIKTVRAIEDAISIPLSFLLGKGTHSSCSRTRR